MEDGSREEKHAKRWQRESKYPHTVQRIDLAALSLRLLTTVLLFLISIIYSYLPLQQVLYNKMIMSG